MIHLTTDIVEATKGFRPRVAIDWDGTLVPSAWPEQPREWLPGAKRALKALDDLDYEIVIYSCRIAPFAFPSAPSSEDDVLRDPEETAREIRYIQSMLDSIGLGHVEIWTRAYKPPAILYIDDRAHQFDGDWRKALRAVMDA